MPTTWYVPHLRECASGDVLLRSVDEGGAATDTIPISHTIAEGLIADACCFVHMLSGLAFLKGTHVGLEMSDVSALTGGHHLIRKVSQISQDRIKHW